MIAAMRTWASRWLRTCTVMIVFSTAGCTSSSTPTIAAIPSVPTPPPSASPTIPGWPPPSPKFTPRPPGHYPGHVVVGQFQPFQLNYPSGWSVDRRTRSETVVYPPGAPQGFGPALIEVQTVLLPTPTTLKGFEHILADGQAGPPSKAFGSAKKSHLSGLPSLTFKVLPPGPSDWEGEDTICVWHGIGYVVVYFALKTEWRTYEPAASLALRSFRVPD
jgi:hypothetical protein